MKSADKNEVFSPIEVPVGTSIIQLTDAFKADVELEKASFRSAIEKLKIKHCTPNSRVNVTLQIDFSFEDFKDRILTA